MTDRRARAAAKIRVAAAIAALAAGSAAPALAAEPDVNTLEPAPGRIDAGHASASAGVRALGAWVDQFFTDEEYEAELNKSWARVRLDSFAEQYSGVDVGARIRLHLKLPSLNKRIRIEILSDSEEQDIAGPASDSVGPPPSEVADENVSTALSYFFSNKERRSVSARVGLDFDGLTPDPFVGARYRENVPLGEDTNFRFVERVRFYSVDGFESRTSLQLAHSFEEGRLFRIGLDGAWLEDEDFFYNFGMSVTEALSEKSAVQYELSSGFTTDPHQLDRVTLRLRYRRKIWRDWLTFEVAPQFSMPRERDFEVVPGIFLLLEAKFGG